MKKTNKIGSFVLALAGIAVLAGNSKSQAQETLADAWNVAITASRQIQAENSAIESQRYQGRAVSAARTPRVIAESSFTALSEQPNADVDVSSMTGDSTFLAVPVLDDHFVSSSINVTVPIYLGGKIAALERAQNFSTRAAIYQRAAVVSQLRLDVAKAYFAVLQMEKIAQVAAATQKSLDSRLTDAQHLLEQGITTQTAYLSIKVAQANATQEVYETDFNLQTARSAYNRLLWRPMTAAVSLADLELPAQTSDAASLAESALRRRPELARLEALSRSLAAKSESSRSEIKPQVVAGASYGYLQNQTLSTNDLAQGTVGMTWTPFDGISRAKANAIRQESLYLDKTREDLANAIRLQVQKAWNDEQSALRKIDVAREAIAQADENLKLVSEQYREGVATYTEVLDSQSLWTRSQTNYYNTYYNALVARFVLEYVVGNL